MFALRSSKLPSRSLLSLNQSRYFASAPKKGIIERLQDGIVIGDGGFVFALEKRGYVKAGPWTPEATVQFPSAVKQLHTEFARAGSDVMQTFTFYASEDKLENRGNYASAEFGVVDINRAACHIAKDVADEFGALFAGGVSQTPTYLSNVGKKFTQNEFKKQVDIFAEEAVDFMIVEYYEHVEECIWAIETIRQHQNAAMANTAIAATLCIGSEGDLHGVSCGDCALQMVEAGARIVGINCHFDPFMVLEATEKMKDALDKQGMLYDAKKNPNGAFLMTQPIAYMTPDAGIQGFIDLPEFPFALEPRVCTRWDIQRYAREAYDMGVKFIGGCCGFEPYHIRAIAQELEPERGITSEATAKHDAWGKGLLMHTKPWVRARANREYWETIKPASGRPHCPACSKPDEWGVTAGDAELKQQTAKTEPIAK